MIMQRRSNLAISFIMALCLHAMGVVFAGRLLVDRILSSAMAPQFQRGKSSLELTLLSPAPQPEQREPAVPVSQPEVKMEEVPPPVVETETVPVSVAEPSRTDADAVPAMEPMLSATVAERPVGPGQNANADMLRKGVESGASPAAPIRPVYPLGSRLRGEEGLVVLNVRVSASGEVARVDVLESSGYSGLDNAAMKAVRMAKFSAALSGGVSTDGETRLTVRFRLVD
ncbi:MAG: energy transducer TonB [bacterium]